MLRGGTESIKLFQNQRILTNDILNNCNIYHPPLLKKEQFQSDCVFTGSASEYHAVKKMCFFAPRLIFYSEGSSSYNLFPNLPPPPPPDSSQIRPPLLQWAHPGFCLKPARPSWLADTNTASKKTAEWQLFFS